MLSSGSRVTLSLLLGETIRARSRIASMEWLTASGLKLKRGLRNTSSYSARSAGDATRSNLPERANSRIRASSPRSFKWAETTTLVSRTALTRATASFPAVALDLQVDFSGRKLVEPVLLGFALDGSQGRRFLYKIAKVILDAHDDGLRLAAPANNKALPISFYSSQDLPELGAGGQGRNNFRDILGGPHECGPRLK